MSIPGVVKCAVIECQLGNKYFLVVVVYRASGSDIKIFFNKLERIVDRVFNENKPTFIVGDFNIEMLKENKFKAELSSLMLSFKFQPHIKENTRITSLSASCLDNIFTNFGPVETLVFEHFISDHKAQKVIFETKYQGTDPQFHRRFFTDKNKIEFLNCLTQQDWIDVYSVQNDDVNKQWNVFMNSFINIFQQNFPLKLCPKFNVSKIFRCPEIKECKRELDILLMLSMRHQNYADRYKQKKREYDELLKRSRAKHYENRITNADNKMKCMWTICNEIKGKKMSDTDIQIEGNPEDIANNFNNHLISIIPDLLKNLPDVPFNCNIAKNDKSMYLKPVRASELSEIAKKIKNKHSCGTDEIPVSIVKKCVDVCN